jgi:hypothetical protein
MSAVRFLGELLRALSAWIEKNRLLVIVGLTAFYLATTLALASQKIFSFDEIFTFEMARRPTVADVWSELKRGTDPQPPLAYLAPRWCMQCFGEHLWAARLPSIVGFWVMCLAAFHFASRWCPVPYALIALLFPLATTAFRNHAYEARPYGMLLGFSGVALVCWQASALGRWRPWALWGLALSLAGALASHYYAVLLWIPLGIGELVRWRRRRRLDWGVAAALACGLAMLLVLLPAILGCRSYMAGFKGQPSWRGVIDFYHTLLDFEFMPLIGFLTFLTFYAQFSRASNEQRERPEKENPLPLHEIAAVGTLVALPFFAMLLGRYATGAYYVRYAMPALLGIALVLAYVASKQGQAVLSMVLLVLLLSWIVAKDAFLYQKAVDQKVQLQAKYEELQRQNPEGLPIAVSLPNVYLTLAYYGPKELARQAVYVDSQELSLRLVGHLDNERALAGLSRLAPLQVVGYPEFVAANPRFRVYGSENWLLKALLADRMDVRVEAPALFLVQAGLAHADTFGSDVHAAERSLLQDDLESLLPHMALGR